MKKSLTVNSIFNIIYKVVATIYPLIAVTYVSHILQASKMGIVAYAQNIATGFALIAALGIPTYGTKEIAKVAYNKNDRSKLFKELFIINFLSTTLLMILYIFLVFSVVKFHSNLILYLVTGLQIVFNYINVDWFYQGMEEYKYISIRSTVVKIISLILLPILVKKESDYIFYALIYSMAIGCNYIFNIFNLRKFITKKTAKLCIRKHIKPILILLVASLAFEAYSLIDTTMLGVFFDDYIVGCYTNAMKLTRMVNTLCTAIGAVLLPRLSYFYSEGNMYEFSKLVNVALKVMLLLAIPASIGIIMLSEECIILLFGESFVAAIPVLRVLALMIPIVVCNSLLGIQVLVTLDREINYISSVGIGAVVNAVLNIVFVPHFGMLGAAATSLISEIIVCCLYVYHAKRMCKISFNPRYFITLFFPIVIYVLISRLILVKFATTILQTLIINIVICCICYFGIGIMLKNEAMIFCLNKARKFLRKQ